MSDRRLVQFRDIDSIEQLTGADWIPQRGLLAYSSTTTGGIILRNLHTAASRRVTDGGMREWRPAFSPDGTGILFLSLHQDGIHIVVYNIEKEACCTIGISNTPVADPIWSPDGSRILFASSVAKSIDKERSAGEPVIVEHLGYKFDGLGFRTPDNATHLYVASADGLENPVKLTEGNYDYLHHNWHPDGRQPDKHRGYG